MAVSFLLESPKGDQTRFLYALSSLSLLGLPTFYMKSLKSTVLNELESKGQETTAARGREKTRKVSNEFEGVAASASVPWSTIKLP